MSQENQDLNTEEKNEYDALVTRKSSYIRNADESKENMPKKRKSGRGKSGIPCKEHTNDTQVLLTRKVRFLTLVSKLTMTPNLS